MINRETISDLPNYRCTELGHFAPGSLDLNLQSVHAPDDSGETIVAHGANPGVAAKRPAGENAISRVGHLRPTDAGGGLQSTLNGGSTDGRGANYKPRWR